VAGTFDCARTWSFRGQLCGAKTDSPHGFVSNVAEDRSKAALEFNVIRGGSGECRRCVNPLSLPKSRGSICLWVFLLLPRWSPDYISTIPFRRLIRLNAPIYPYLGLPTAVYAADISAHAGLNIGTADVYKTTMGDTEVTLPVPSNNGISERNTTSPHWSDR